MHNQCSSNACLPDGSCGDDSNVAYVDPAGTDNVMCTREAPCTTVAKALGTRRLFVKFHGSTHEAVSIVSQNVTLLADPDAALINSGLILEVRGTSNVKVYDLTITGGSGSGGIGISMPTGNTATVELQRVKILNNAGGGIVAGGGQLIVSQSRIDGNMAGGISVNAPGTFSIVGNFFARNGSGTSAFGGLSISTAQAATNRLEFNSFNKNGSQDGVGSAIQCIAGAFTARNNILFGNGTATNLEQVGGSCQHTYTIAQPGTLPVGAGNMAKDPLFRDVNAGDLHVQPGSPALGAADPNSDLTGIAAHDIDGDARIKPADIGADEVP